MAFGNNSTSTLSIVPPTTAPAVGTTQTNPTSSDPSAANSVANTFAAPEPPPPSPTPASPRGPSRIYANATGITGATGQIFQAGIPNFVTAIVPVGNISIVIDNIHFNTPVIRTIPVPNVAQPVNPNKDAAAFLSKLNGANVYVVTALSITNSSGSGQNITIASAYVSVPSLTIVVPAGMLPTQLAAYSIVTTVSYDYLFKVSLNIDQLLAWLPSGLADAIKSYLTGGTPTPSP